MNKLVLGSLLLAALATGCIITSDDTTTEDTATINADWSFHTVNNQGALSPNNPCPTGYNTVALHSQELDANDRPVGAEIVDLFDCAAGRDFSDPLVPSVYETFLSVTSDSGVSVYAETIPAIVDVTAADKTYSASIVDNGGYFKATWDLRSAATNAPISCGGIGGVEISATISGAQTSIFDTYDCIDGFAYTDALIEGTYLVQVSALKSGSDTPIGTKDITNQIIHNLNEVTDLGMVQVSVTP